MIKSVITFAASIALTFLAFAFIIWDINPANWEVGTRGLAIITGLALGCLGPIISGDL